MGFKGIHIWYLIQIRSNVIKPLPSKHQESKLCSKVTTVVYDRASIYFIIPFRCQTSQSDENITGASPLKLGWFSFSHAFTWILFIRDINRPDQATELQREYQLCCVVGVCYPAICLISPKTTCWNRYVQINSAVVSFCLFQWLQLNVLNLTRLLHQSEEKKGNIWLRLAFHWVWCWRFATLIFSAIHRNKPAEAI